MNELPVNAALGRPMSMGHVCFVGPWEFLHGPDGTLYRGQRCAPFDAAGYRADARFECMPRQDGHARYMSVVYGEAAE